MKKNVLLLFSFFLVALSVSAQTKQDQTVILKKCLDLPGIQKFFPVDINNDPLQVIIIERHPSILRFDLPVRKFNKDIKYVFESDIENIDPQMYLIFNEFEISDVAGDLSFDIRFSQSSGKKPVHVTLAISKNGDDWSILSESIK